ncbi:MAG: SpoIID/LytB domain-containing protein [Bacteroidales bacterium]
MWRIVLGSLVFLLFVSARADQLHPEMIDVGIFSGQPIQHVTVVPAAGGYLLTDIEGQPVVELEKHQPVKIALMGEHCGITLEDSTFYMRSEVVFQGHRWENFLVIHVEGHPYRMYDDDLVVRAGEERLVIVNRVAVDNYVAGVVQSESGWMHDMEYYKVQAIIARTYALRNGEVNGHSDYHVCDGVHCQAYYSRSGYADIIQAVALTRGDVVVDEQDELINAVYHANCGGETVASENAWQRPQSYLKSVTDSFCIQQPGARWETSIPRSEFFGFLEEYFSINPSAEQEEQLLNFTQLSRKYVLHPFDEVRLTLLRNRFNFRSTFFSFSPFNDMIHVRGRGYGHGVGLCQEGAMVMAQKGYPAAEIIRFYYQGVTIRTLE